MRRVASAVYWLSLSVWLGSIICFTFVVTPRLGVALPDAFGDAVAAIFPAYFKLGGVASALVLIAGWRALPARPNIWTRRGSASSWAHRASVVGLAVATWGAALWAYPHTVTASPAQFGTWHGITMGLNVLALVFAMSALLIRSLARDGGAARKSS